MFITNVCQLTETKWINSIEYNLKTHSKTITYFDSKILFDNVRKTITFKSNFLFQQMNKFSTEKIM